MRVALCGKIESKIQTENIIATFCLRECSALPGNFSDY